MAKMKRLALAALGVGMLAISACGKGQQEARETHLSHAPNGDLREITESASALPSFLDGQADAIRVAYRAAAVLEDTLQWIPCYCGCGGSAGHRSNLDCFVSELREDGTVEWDDHGTRCNVCVQIALESARLKEQGKTNLEIRQSIDAKYGTGYADPTDTPMPAGA